MSTTPVETWATELAEIGPIYPFLGNEGLMVFLLFVAWIVWHIWQIRFERQQEEDLLRRLRDGDNGQDRQQE